MHPLNLSAAASGYSYGDWESESVVSIIIFSKKKNTFGREGSRTDKMTALQKMYTKGVKSPLRPILCYTLYQSSDQRWKGYF